MRRRDFITITGGAASAWPLAARAQQPQMRMIGFLSPGWSVSIAQGLAAFRRHLAKTGFVEGQNVIIDYRWGEGRSDRLPDPCRPACKSEQSSV